MTMWGGRAIKIIETDNYGGDYPNEKFVNLPSMKGEHAKAVATAINQGFSLEFPRYWTVVSDDYELRPGFEP